jgi:hypothetical protein
MFHELDERSGDGIVVRLIWDAYENRVLVEYCDDKREEAFVLEVPADQALSAFHHPNAYRREPAAIAA